MVLVLVWSLLLLIYKSLIQSLVGRFADMDAEFDEFLKNFDSWQVHLLIASFSIFLLLSQTPHWHAMNHI